MLTGHSLGAGLAGMLSVMGSAISAPPPQLAVAAFSSPGLLAALRNHNAVDPASANTSRTLFVADEWDPVFHAGNATLLGTTCQWESPESLECKVCFDRLPGQDAACALCFKDHHVYAHYLGLVYHADRPTCYTHRPPGAPRAGRALL